MTHLKIKSNSSSVSWIFSSWNQLWISWVYFCPLCVGTNSELSHRLRQTHMKLSGHKHSLCVVTLRCGEAWNLISLQWRLSAATHSVRVLNCVGSCCCCCWTHTCQQTRFKLFYFTQRGSEMIYVEQKIQGAVCTECQHHFISIHTWKYMQYDKFVSSPSNWFLQGIWAHLTRVI